MAVEVERFHFLIWCFAMRRWPVVLVLAGCHTIVRDQVTRPTATKRVQLAPTARAPTLVLTEAGRLRFVEPLECATEETVTQLTSTEIITTPNYATLVVGIIATAVGGVMTVRGISDDDPGSSPFLYGGLGLVVGGLPFAIGPLINNRTELVPGAESEPVKRAGPVEPCGERALRARAATLTVRGMEVRGTIDQDGIFGVSPYVLVDAFEPGASRAWEIHAAIESDAGTRKVTAILDNGKLVTHAKAFLAKADFDTKIEPMRLVPGIVPGALRASLTPTASGPTVRIVLPLKNDGPGPAWALRGHVIAPSVPAIDGRVIYAGSLAKGATRDLAGMIPVTDTAAANLRNASIEFSIELRDAHGTAPTTPIRFRGTLLVDAPR